MSSMVDMKRFEEIGKNEDEIRFLAKIYVNILKEIIDIQNRIQELKNEIYR